MSKFSYIIKNLNKEITRLIFVFLCVLGHSFFTLFGSLVFGFVIDQVVSGEETNNILLLFIEKSLGGLDYIRAHLWVIFIFLLVIYLITSILMYLRYNNQGIVAETLAKNIRDDLYRHIELMPYGYHVKAKTGDLIQRCTSDIDTIRRFFSGQIEEIVAIVFSVIIAFSILFSLNVRLTLIASISVPIIFIFSYTFFLKIQKKFKASDEKEGEMTVDIQESLSGIRVVKAFHREKYEIDKFLKESKEYSDITYDMISALGTHWGISYLVCMMGIVSVILFGILFVRNGMLRVGSFLVFVNYQTQILYQIRHLGRILSDFGKVSVSLNRLLEIKNEPIEDLKTGLDVDLNGDIIFNNVSFKYEDDDFEVLKDINMHIKKGETVAIVGPTGCGKSSLVHLLARLYDVSSGEILINGYNINTVSKERLRKSIGIVLQETFLFSKSIYDNLSISDPSLDSKAIERATKIANVHDVINDFERGYNTLVGEKGVTLSGGQKQRIAIARTIVNNTPIIIFDDSLSAVDAKTDAAIRDALKALDSLATMIIITQRIASAKQADMIYVIENGRITQCGKHEQLITEDGLYARINDLQTLNYKEGLNV